jgi:hypothetical protein
VVASVSAADKAKPAFSTDMDDVVEHVREIREDFASLAPSTGKLSASQARIQRGRFRTFAGGAAERASGFRDLVTDAFRAHAPAAIGIAVLAGLIVAPTGRR